VTVAFVVEELVIVAVDAVRLVVTSLDDVALVVEAFVATRFVVVALVAVRLVKNAVKAVKRLAKRLDEVAFVLDAFVAKKVVAVALVVLRLVTVPVAVERLAMVVVASVEVPDAVRVLSAVLPEIERAVADALPRDDVPDVSVEKTPVVNVGLAESAMVLVPEKTMFDPATKLETGLLRKVLSAVVDAVSGSEYPACVPSVKVCTPVPVLVVTVRLRPPDVDVANDCEAAALPLSVEIVPPAPPASVPQ
jgi:hypothetical protein